MSSRPSYLPDNAGDAFKHINAVTNPTIDDLKLMVYLEASGKVGYGELAETAPNEAVAKLLNANGREEVAHAHRVANVIEILTGEKFMVPADADNPYAKKSGKPVSKTTLEYLVNAEFFGDKLYHIWADNCPNAEAATLLRQNGVEETKHGKRAQEALGLMDA